MTEAEWLEIFGTNLTTMLYEAKLTQRDLADMTGLSEGTISYYINKRKMPGIKAIINIAEALDCSIDDLIYFGSTIY